jgi:hypothetical protein
MRVLIKHGDVWLQLKEVYVLQRRPRKRGRRTTSSASPYVMVAESVENIKIDGYKYKDAVIVPASKVSRFAARAHMTPMDAVILIEPEAPDKYRAIIYAKSKKGLEDAREAILRILSTLYTRRGREEVLEENEEEPESEEEEE